MRTLFVSDLDGTLLTEQATVSEFTAGILRKLAGQGVHFTVATARTAATVSSLLRDIPLACPAILMNGVCLYSIDENRYDKVSYLNPDAAGLLLTLVGEARLSGFLYTLEGEKLQTCYERTETSVSQAFLEERVRKYGKVFTKVESFRQCDRSHLIYYSVCDQRAKLLPLAEQLSRESAFRVECYRDIYTPGDYYYLEVFSSSASKYEAVRYLRKRYGYDNVVSFGDNGNDLPLFRASDRSFAVANACQEVREAADGVIGSNREDGVARFLLAHGADGFSRST